MGEVIHIAGQAVTVGTVMRQRCAWCADGAVDWRVPVCSRQHHTARLTVTERRPRGAVRVCPSALLEHRDNSLTSVAVDASASQEVQREEATRALAIKWEGLVAVDGPVRCSRPRTCSRSAMRSFASLLIHEGRLSPVEIADQLGHSTQTLLKDYAHVFSELRGQDKMGAVEAIVAARAGDGRREAPDAS